MRLRLPLLPTLFTLAALALLITLGCWQLQRAQWKAQLLLRLSAAAEAPQQILGNDPLSPDLGFHHVRLRLQCAAQKPIQRAGEAKDGRSGYAQQLMCKAPAGETVLLVAGWSARLDPLWQPPSTMMADGMLIAREGQSPYWSLVADPPVAPLLAAAPPSLESIPNNHRGYAFQWFAFAAILLVIYGFYVRGWQKARAKLV